ncbi:MAG: hypothetical protein ACF8PN_05380 [Phycisphaerales bacterium]
MMTTRHELRRAMVGVAALLLILITAPAVAQSNSLDARLTELSPEEPLEYFRLGEEAADLGRVGLARELFTLAATLDPDGLGRSSAMALAAIARDEGDTDSESRLLGMAEMFPAPNVSDARSTRDERLIAQRDARREAAGAVSNLLGYYRLGAGAAALKTLEENPGAETLLTEYGRELGSIGSIIAYCRDHPRCPTCRNERIIKCPSCRGGADPGRCAVCHDRRHLVCTLCDGHPGPDLDDDELNAMLNFETALLSEVNASWEAQLDLDGGRPRPVLDPASLPQMMGVDPFATVYRGGEWRAP